MSDTSLHAEVLPAERALIPLGRVGGNIISPLVSVEEAVEAWEHYQKLTAAILDESDYQKAGSKRFKKKSAWRKYMRFYGLDEEHESTKIDVTRNGHRDFRVKDGLPLGFPLVATAFVVIRSPQGKLWTGYHECHAAERCCPAAQGLACSKKDWKSHDCCKEGCAGLAHWSHPGDIPATAHTRAKNRAISDAIGAGEVSAEEVGATEDETEEKPTVCPECGKTGTIIKGKAEFGGGWLCWKKAKAGGCGAKFDTDPALGKGGKWQEGVSASEEPPPPEERASDARGEPDVNTADGLFRLLCKVLGGDKPKDFAADLSAHLASSLGLASINDLKDATEADRLTNLRIVEKRAAVNLVAARAWVQENAREFRERPKPESLIPVQAETDWRAAAAAAGRKPAFIDGSLNVLEVDLKARRDGGASGRELIAYAEAAIKREIGKLKPAPPAKTVAPPGPMLAKEPGAYEADDSDVPF